MGGVSDLIQDIEENLRDLHDESPRPTWEEAVARLQRDFNHKARKTGMTICLDDDEGRAMIKEVFEEIGADWDEDWEEEEEEEEEETPATMEALEAAFEAFLDTPQVDSKMHDALTDEVARAFQVGEQKAAEAMELVLSQKLLPLIKTVCVVGLTDSRAAELNNRLGILVSSTAQMGSAPISLVPTGASPVEWLNIKLANLRPTSLDAFKQAVEAAIAQGTLSKFADLLSRPPARGKERGDDEDEEEEEGDGEEDGAWAGAAPPLRKGLAAGSPISLTGIASKPALNGRHGWSLGLNPSNGRCVVQLEPLPSERGMPEPFAVRAECIDGGADFPADLTGVASYISDAEIAEELAGSNCNGRRSVEQTKRAIRAAHTVLDRFYYGADGPEGLEPGVAKRMDYLTRIFHNRDKIKWWVANMVASGSPDFMCAHTGAEVHFYCLNARQMAAFVRTGYDPSYGVLPQQLHAKLVLEEY